jgi:hypothetical protein
MNPGASSFVDGQELNFPSWQRWSSRDPLERRAIEEMVVGVSTRRYARSLEPLPNGVRVSGVGKSAHRQTPAIVQYRMDSADMGRKRWAHAPKSERSRIMSELARRPRGRSQLPPEPETPKVYVGEPAGSGDRKCF